MALIIDIYSHHFIVSGVDAFHNEIILSFVRQLVEIHTDRDAWGNLHSKAVRVYAVKSKVDHSYRLHINLFESFKQHMSDKGVVLKNITYHPLYTPEFANIEMKKGWEPFEEQKPVIEYIVQDGIKKVIDAQTGQGKTLMTMFALAQIKQRVAMVIKPMYIERWLDVIVGDGTVLQHTTKNDVVVVRGGKQLRGLIYMAQEGKLNAQFIVISNTTLSLYYKHYKEFGASEEYGWVHPEDFWKLLGVGVRVIDEAHEHFYVCFITDLNSHVHKSVELSATLEPDNPFLKRMYNIMYPKHLRMNTGAYKRYIEVYGLTYHILDDPKYIQTSNRGRSTYSQAAYETNIFKQKPRMVRLRKMMLGLTERLFMSERLPEHKLLIFFETIDMCTDIASVLKDAYPHLKVSRYTEEEDASVLDTHDIIVATPKSAGTAVDIKKLQIVISFVMRNSTQAVEQMIGRLRQLKTDKLQPKFYYLFTRQIDTHVRYHHKKQEIMKFKALSLDEQISGYEI